MKLYTINHDGQRYVNFTIEALRESGVPQAVVDQLLADDRLTAIKVECRRRIYAQASPEAQMNVATALGAASAKTASARSAQETALIAGAQAAIGWVTAMRDNIATLATDAQADITADASWPACPAEAVAVYSQF